MFFWGLFPSKKKNLKWKTSGSYNFPEPKVMTSEYFFTQSNSPEPNVIQLSHVINNRNTYANTLELGDVWYFSMKTKKLQNHFLSALI